MHLGSILIAKKVEDTDQWFTDAIHRIFFRVKMCGRGTWELFLYLSQNPDKTQVQSFIFFHTHMTNK